MEKVDLFKGIDEAQLPLIADALDFAAHADTLALFAKRLKDKLMQAHPGKAGRFNIVYDRPNENLQSQEEFIWRILSAISERKLLKLQNGKIGDDRYQEILPVCIVQDCSIGRNYLMGYSEEKEKALVLRLDRIRDLKISSKDYHIDIDNDDYVLNELDKVWYHLVEDAWNVSVTNEKYHVIIDFTKQNNILYRLECEQRHGIITEIEDAYRFEIDINDWKEMLPWVMSYGSDALVIEPEPLKDWVIGAFKKGLEGLK